MGAGLRPTIDGAFDAEARRQQKTRPATRPRPPPITDYSHTSPLWSEHLQTYVSYSWREQKWKRWSLTVKLWKIIRDINAVISAESKLQEDALRGQRTMPPKPQSSEWSDPLWFEAHWCFVSYNSISGQWLEWVMGNDEGGHWMSNSLSGMPVSSMEIEEGKLPEVTTPPVAIPSILPALANRGQQAEASKRNLDRTVEETSTIRNWLKLLSLPFRSGSKS